MDQRKELMLHTSEYTEVWEVYADRKTYQLNEKQIAVIHEASIQNIRGMVWFDGFSISIPHISSTVRISRKKKVPGEEPMKNTVKSFEPVMDANGNIIKYKEILMPL